VEWVAHIEEVTPSSKEREKWGQSLGREHHYVSLTTTKKQKEKRDTVGGQASSKDWGKESLAEEQGKWKSRGRGNKRRQNSTDANSSKVKEERKSWHAMACGKSWRRWKKV